jgi:hypothetical protein
VLLTRVSLDFQIAFAEIYRNRYLMKKPISISAVIFLALSSLTAQINLSPTVIASGGGYAEGENITISWTLGELAVATLAGENLVLTQGFQQPFDIDVGVFEQEKVNWDISAYPNPVGSELRVRFNIESAGDFLMEIQDVTGRIVSQQEYRQVNPGDIIQINTSDYYSGIYFLKVYSKGSCRVEKVIRF